MSSDFPQFTIKNINKVPASRGWFWLNEGVRYFMQARFVWLASLIIVMAVLMFSVYLLPAAQIMFVFIFPFVVAGLSLACADIEQGRLMNLDYLLKGFRSPNRLNILKYGFLLIVLLIIAQIVSSIIMTIYGVSQEQIADEIIKLSTNKDANLNTILESSTLVTFAIVTFISMIPIAVINLLSPILLVFTQYSALEAVKLSIVAGVKNFSAFIVYATIFILILVVVILLLNVFSSVLVMIFGQESFVATFVYFTVFITVMAMIMSISYSSSYVAFKDIYLEPKSNEVLEGE
jgi:magnesium-transporting ATPase (P-type)